MVTNQSSFTAHHFKINYCSIFAGKLKSTIKKLLLWKESNFNSNDTVIESLDLNEKSFKKKDSKSKGNSFMPKLTFNSTDDIPLDKRISDLLQKDKESLETNNLPASNKSKMLKALSSASLSSPKMRQTINFEKCKSTSKLPSLKNTEIQKTVAEIKNKTMSRLDGNISPNNHCPLKKQVNESSMKVKSGNAHSPTPEKNNEASSVIKRKMLRSRSTVSLKSVTPISCNKKDEKNTISRAKSVSMLKMSSEEEEAEIAIQKPMSRSVRAKLFKNSCVDETPTDSNKIVKKKNVPSMLSYSIAKLQKANLNEKEINGSANKRTKSENSPKSVGEETIDEHSSTWAENQSLSNKKSQLNVQQKSLTVKPLDKTKSIKVSSKINNESKQRKYSSKPSDTTEVETDSYDHSDSSCSVVTPAQMRVLNPEHSSEVTNSRDKSFSRQRKKVQPIYLNSSDSSLTSSPLLENSPFTSKKKKYKNNIKPNNESQVSKDSKQTSKETKSHDDDSNKCLKSTKQQTFNTSSSKIKTPINSNKRSYSQETSEETNVSDKGKRNLNPKSIKLDLSNDDAQSLTMKKTSQQNEKNKVTRSSLSKGPFKKDYQKGSIFSGIHERYLKSFTRKLHFLRAYEIGDVSESDIQDVTMPEKFDLNCKVRITTLFLDQF